jgi:hypothetical protein
LQEDKLIEATFNRKNDGSALAFRFHQRNMMTKSMMIYQVGTYGGVDQQNKTTETGRFTTKHGRFNQQIHDA